MIDTIRRLVEAYGPSGHEDQIRDIILEEVKGASDEVGVDALGNVTAWKRSRKKDTARVMLAAHMDEIGLIISFVEKEGFLRFTNIGTLIPHTLYGNRVRFADGTIGVIGVERDYTFSEAPRLEHLFVDVSSGQRQHAIRVGSAASLHREMTVNGDRLIAKSLDGRVGCAVLIEVMRQIKKPANDVAFAFTTQEEVGSRGAKTAAHAVEPQMAVAVGVTPTGDTTRGFKTDIALGKGPAIKIRDAEMIASPEVVALMERTAKAARLPYQREVLTLEATDATQIQVSRAGVKSGGLLIPCRYLHTTSEMVDLNDVRGAVRLLVKLLENPPKV